MNITIKSIGFKPGDNLETFVREKVKKLSNQCDYIIHAYVNLKKGNHKNYENRSCEIRLVVPGYDHYVKKSSVGYRKSVLDSVDALQEILRRSKTRLYAKR